MVRAEDRVFYSLCTRRRIRQLAVVATTMVTAIQQPRRLRFKEEWLIFVGSPLATLYTEYTNHVIPHSTEKAEQHFFSLRYL